MSDDDLPVVRVPAGCNVCGRPCPQKFTVRYTPSEDGPPVTGTMICADCKRSAPTHERTTHDR